MQPMIPPPDIQERSRQEEDTPRRGVWSLTIFVVLVLITVLAILFLVTNGSEPTGTPTGTPAQATTSLRHLQIDSWIDVGAPL